MHGFFLPPKQNPIITNLFQQELNLLVSTQVRLLLMSMWKSAAVLSAKLTSLYSVTLNIKILLRKQHGVLRRRWWTGKGAALKRGSISASYRRKKLTRERLQLPQKPAGKIKDQKITRVRLIIYRPFTTAFFVTSPLKKRLHT